MEIFSMRVVYMLQAMKWNGPLFYAPPCMSLPSRIKPVASYLFRV